MASEWYIARSGQRLGPYSSSDLRRLAVGGQLQPSELVWKDGMKKWHPASKIKGLFPASPPAGTEDDSPGETWWKESQEEQILEAMPVEPPEPPPMVLPVPPPLGRVPAASRSSASPRATDSALPLIRPDQLPRELRDKAKPEETIHHFGYIDAKGGCANPSSAKQWILVTNKRILFEASVKEGPGEGGKFVHQSGSIPMAKVSYVGTSTRQDQQGCAQVKVTNLRINSSGGEIVLAIPTKQEAERAQEVIDEILSRAR